MNVSFITVNYNSFNHTKNLINSIYSKTVGLNYEIIIVDNASHENDILSLEDYIKDKDNITLIKNKINSGFSSGNMLGANIALGRYLYFINNDCMLLNNSAKIMMELHEKNKKIALSTARILNKDGSNSISHGSFPSIIKELFGSTIKNKISKTNFPNNRYFLEKDTKVEVISGACMFFKASYFYEIGGLDTNLFLYCEEEDICKRILMDGKEIYFIYDAIITHLGGGSTKKNFSIENEYYISYYHLLKKHFNFIQRAVLKTILSIKLASRVFKRKNGLKIFISLLGGFNVKNSIKYTQFKK